MLNLLWITLGYSTLTLFGGVWLKALGNSKRDQSLKMDEDLKDLETEKRMVIRGQTQIEMFNKQIKTLQAYLDTPVSTLEKAQIASQYEDAVKAHRAAQEENRKWLDATKEIREQMRIEAERKRRIEEETRRKEQEEEDKRRRKRQEEEEEDRRRRNNSSSGYGGGYGGGYSSGGDSGGGFSGGGGSSSGGGADGGW